MSTKKIISGTIYYGIIPKLTILINVLILPLITPYLTAEDYGIHGIVTSYATVFLAIAPMGLHIHLTNSYYEYPNDYRKVWGRIFFLFLILGFIFGVVNMIILSLVLPRMPLVNLVLLSLIGSVQIFFFANGVLAQTIFPLMERPRPLVFTNLLSSCLGIIVSFILIYYLHLGYWGLISTVAVSTLASFLIFTKLICFDFDIRPIIERNKRRLHYFFRIALPLVPHALGFALLTSSARIIMTAFDVSYEDIGLFSHGCIMGDYAVIITSALSIALVASIQKSYRNCQFNVFRKLYYLCQGVSLLSSSLFCIWMKEIYMLLIHNDSLAESASIASLICFANVVLPLYTFMSTTAFIEKNTKQVLWLVFVPGIMNLIICLALIPYIGYRIAVYASILAHWSQLLIPFLVSYYRSTVSCWLGNKNKLIVIFLMMVTCLLISNSVSHCSIVFRGIVTMVLLSIFGYWYYSRKVFAIV